MEATTYHPIEAPLPYKLKSPFMSGARPMFGMPGWGPDTVLQEMDADPVLKPKSPSRPAQPNNAGTMPTAGRQLAAMRDRKL